jgi:CRP-like cAMP-binding protein
MRPVGRGGAFALALRNRDGRLLVGAFTAVTIAEWMAAAALAVHLLDVGGKFAVGLLAVLFLPTALAGLGAGTVSERRPPERVLVATVATRTLLICGAAGALAAGWPIGIVVAIVGVDAGVAAFYRPAQAALLPFLARSPTELGGLAGELSTTRTVAQAGGTVLGGLLIASVSAATVFAGAAASFALAGLLTAALAVRTEVLARGRGKHADAVAGSSGGVFGVARHGLSAFAAIARHSDSRIVIALAALRAAIRGAWLGLAVLAAAGFLGMGRAGFGQLAAAAGVGAVIAIPAASLLVGSRRLATALGASLAVTGLALAGVAALGTPTAALVLVAVWGASMALADLAATAVLPRIADARRLGQMTAITESFKQSAEGAGSLLVPLFVVALGVQGALAAIGLLAPIAVLAAWRTLARVDAAAGRRVARIDLIRSTPLLRTLRVVELEAVASAARPSRVAPNEHVIREGDRDARTFYVIGFGEADVVVEGHLLRTLGTGDSFGEIALLHGIQRTATVRARSPLELLELDRSDFIWAVTGGEQSGLVRRRAPSGTDLADGPLRDAVSFVPWIARLDSAVIGRLADNAQRASAEAGNVLWTQGAQGDTMVILLSGEATVEQGGRIEATIGPGEWVGEVALLHDVPRTATVRARTAVTYCELQREHVHEALSLTDEHPAHLVEQLA